MKSYSDLRTMFGDYANTTLSTDLNFGDRRINDGIRKVLAMPIVWDFTEETSTGTTVASQQFYDLPYDYGKLNTVTVTVGSTTYLVQPVESRETWDLLNESSYTSDVPEYYYIYDGDIGLYPTPASSSNTITYNYKKTVKDLSNADYTTGTVTLTNDSAAVVGAGTTFTEAMVGRWLKGDNDGFWYEIASFTDATNITLDKAWQGTTSAGLSYTIGEMPLLPENFHDLPVYWALMAWYSTKNTDTNKFSIYDKLWREGLEQLIDAHGSKNKTPVLSRVKRINNPNSFITA